MAPKDRGEKQPDPQINEQTFLQFLMQLAQRIDLSIEQRVEVAEQLSQVSERGSAEEQFSYQMLVQVAQYSDLSVKQSILIAVALYQNSASEGA